MIFVIIAILNFTTITISDSPQSGQCASTSGTSSGGGIASTLLGNLFNIKNETIPTTTIPLLTGTRNMIPGSDYNTYFF